MLTTDLDSESIKEVKNIYLFLTSLELIVPIFCITVRN